MQPAGSGHAPVHLQRFSVAFDYPVVFCRGAFDPAEPTLAWAISRREPERRHRVYVVVDSGVAQAWPDLAQRFGAYVERYQTMLEWVGPLDVIVGGEAAKNDMALVTELHGRFARERLDRQSTVLVIGGGAVLDAAGYAASITHRGLRVVRMPTTVLAQNDAGVGVKNGVNATGVKNFLGTFAPPFAVVNDLDLLSTLPTREARAGMAEAVKVALIRDARFFEWLESNAEPLAQCEPAALEVLIRRCAQLHLEHIASSGDPFETGSARPLDYGHWSAHKLEVLTGHELRHGEAVAIGMALDARYAERKGLLKPANLERVCRVLETIGLRTEHPALCQTASGRPAVLEGLQEFREHLGGNLTIPLLTDIGRFVEVTEVDEPTMIDSIRWLVERKTSSCSSTA
jgi:3-dehydroquinate synthase